VRYADDLVAMCATREEAEAALRLMAEILGEMGLELKASKTRILHLEEGGEGFDFLGFHHRWVHYSHNDHSNHTNHLGSACRPLDAAACEPARSKAEALGELRAGLTTCWVWRASPPDDGPEGRKTRVGLVHPRRTVPLGLLVLACLLGGCSVFSPSPSPRAVPKTELGYEIAVGRVGGLGRVLVNVSGRTLYLYVPDHQGASRCNGFCAREWPPMLAPVGKGSVRFGPGVDVALVGSVRRADGVLQLTYNRWPLYAWRLDASPGEATGEGDDMGLWYAISPSGDAVY